MYWTLLIVAFLALWLGATLVLDAWLRPRPSLVERLRPYVEAADGHLADEATDWLRRQA